MAVSEPFFDKFSSTSFVFGLANFGILVQAIRKSAPRPRRGSSHQVVAENLGPFTTLSNNRINAPVLNLSCVSGSVLESMLLLGPPKNLFQQTASRSRCSSYSSDPRFAPRSAKHLEHCLAGSGSRTGHGLVVDGFGASLTDLLGIYRSARQGARLFLALSRFPPSAWRLGARFTFTRFSRQACPQL